MNKRALFIGLIYCVIVIVYKLIILTGGSGFSTKFGYYYSHIVSVFFIIPFFYIAIRLAREKDNGGVIGGKDALRIGLTVLAVAMVVLSTYNYFESSSQIFKEEAAKYYNSETYLKVLKDIAVKVPDKLKEEDFPKIIQEQINGLSPGKATTAKLIPLLLIGLSGAFVTAMFMKRSTR